jgi:hypothetical protein
MRPAGLRKWTAHSAEEDDMATSAANGSFCGGEVPASRAVPSSKLKSLKISILASTRRL